MICLPEPKANYYFICLSEPSSDFIPWELNILLKKADYASNSRGALLQDSFLSLPQQKG